MVDFKGSQFPKDVILYAVWFYVRFSGAASQLVSSCQNARRPQGLQQVGNAPQINGMWQEHTKGRVIAPQFRVLSSLLNSITQGQFLHFGHRLPEVFQHGPLAREHINGSGHAGDEGDRLAGF